MYEFLDYRVEDAMSREPVRARPEQTLREIEEIFERHAFNGLPVVDAEDRLVGWVTKLDLLRAFRFDEEHMFPPYEEIMRRPVSSVMSQEVLGVTPRAPLTKVLEKLVDTRNKSLPVVDDDRVVGVVAREDVMRALRRADDHRKPAD